MSDIVERLDEHDPVDMEAKTEILRLRELNRGLTPSVAARIDMADELARLRAEVERLRDAKLGAGSEPINTMSALLKDKDAELARLRAAVLWHCEACGTMTRDGECDCTTMETGTQRLVPFDPKDMSNEIVRLRAEAVKLRTCPDCAFAFDAVHKDEGGGYSCPNCEEYRLRAEVDEAEKDAADNLVTIGHLRAEVEKLQALLSSVAIAIDSIQPAISQQIWAALAPAGKDGE